MKDSYTHGTLPDVLKNMDSIDDSVWYRNQKEDIPTRRVTCCAEYLSTHGMFFTLIRFVIDINRSHINFKSLPKRISMLDH